MEAGTIALATPDQNQGAPSAAAFVIGTPSPAAPSNTGYQPVGNSSSYSTSFTDFISGLEKKAVGAITGVGNQVVYKADSVLGTVQKSYYTTISDIYGAVGSGAQTVQDVATKVTQTSGLIIFAIVAFLAFPYIMALRKK